MCVCVRVCASVCLSVCVRKTGGGGGRGVWGGEKKKSEKRRKREIWAAVWFRCEQRHRSAVQPRIDPPRVIVSARMDVSLGFNETKKCTDISRKTAKDPHFSCIFLGLNCTEVGYLMLYVPVFKKK